MSSAAPAMKHISVSKIEKFLQCPLSFKYRYVDKIPEPSAGVLLSGKVVHEVLEHALRAYAKTDKYPEWQELDDMFLPVWERQKKEEEEKETFLTWQFNEDDPHDKVRDESRALVRVARQDALPKIRPWLIGPEPVIEYRIDLELDSELGPFKLLGFIDLLDASGILMDWKTTRNKVSNRAKKNWLQFAAYSLHVWPLIGNEMVKCQKIFLVRGDDPRVEFCDFEITPKHREWFVNIAAQVWRSIYYGVYPARSGEWFCNQKFCSFWGPCQEGIWTPDPEEVIPVESK